MLRATSLLAAILVMPGMAAAQVSNLYDVYASAIDADPRVRIAQHQVELGKAQADNALGVMAVAGVFVVRRASRLLGPLRLPLRLLPRLRRRRRRRRRGLVRRQLSGGLYAR